MEGFKFIIKLDNQVFFVLTLSFYYIGSAEGHEYPDLQVGDEVNPRPVFMSS